VIGACLDPIRLPALRSGRPHLACLAAAAGCPAAALPGDPQVIVPDEPATGLDARGAGWLRRQIRHWAAAGRTVLAAGHSLTELAPAADRVLVLDQGPIIGQAAAGELGPGAALSEALPGLLTAKPRTRP